MIFKLVISIVAQTLVFAALLFVPAGTLAWWRAWVFFVVVLFGTLAASFGIFKVSKDLLAERLKPPIQKDQTRADKILVSTLIAAFAALVVLVPLDVFHLHLLAKPSIVISSLGLTLFIAGWWLAYLGMRANAFAAPVVKYQKSRAHTVVDTGPYRVVRHPMYAGALPVFIGMPLWLESYAAAVFAIVPIGLLVLRILAEEDFLQRELFGYATYASRVRYRLIPFVW